MGMAICIAHNQRDVVTGRSVLILDSNLLDVLEAESHLVRDGFRVSKLTGSNGALARIEYEKPEVVLLDITMARLNVQEMLEALRSDPELEEIVVVLYSNLDGPTLQQMCRENNIHGYFSKSMDITRIGQFINQFFVEDEV
jgi:PleD family two-component response regulator